MAFLAMVSVHGRVANTNQAILQWAKVAGIVLRIELTLPQSLVFHSSNLKLVSSPAAHALDHAKVVW